MVEAAIVLPATIMTLLTVVLIVIFFCNLSVEQSRMHIAINEAAGRESEHTVTNWDTPCFSGSTTKEKNLIKARSSQGLPDIFSILKRDRTTVEGNKYIVDGVENVRKKTWIKKLSDRDKP